MSGRPEILFPLFAELTTLPGIGPKTAPLLAHLGVEHPRDLAFTLPHSGIDRALRPTVQGQPEGATVTVEVTVQSHAAPSNPARPYRVTVTDSETSFELVYFHAKTRWIDGLLPVGARRVVSGRIERFDGRVQMAHPDYVIASNEMKTLPEFEPVYPLTAGITQKAMFKASEGMLSLLPDLQEWADPGLVAQKDWAGWRASVRSAHRPQESADLAATAAPRERLAYDELFAHQMTLALARAARRQKKSRKTIGTGALTGPVMAQLPFAPTTAQHRAVAEITADMATELRMNRLLQGDVGSGKTLVALIALITAVEAGGQGVLMAPTEILARQHHAGLTTLAAASNLRIEVLTGRDKGSDRAAKLAALASGEIGVLVGTHAVFQRGVEFADLRLAVIDEQHRFGVRERAELGAKGAGVDVLVMTATPIPRSLSLAQYGDMEISVLDEKPPGRTPVTTALVSAERMDAVVARLKAQVADGRQAYWVCPLVAESETLEATAAEERFKRLRAALGEGAVGLVHGQMPSAEKDAAMADFVAGRTQVLVATTVIEVGVDVPNASIMVIEGAERFGLSQLHQLRGRVGRGAEASTCLLMYQGEPGETARRRLEILRETEDGFRIAEEDLALRGAGDVIGHAQSGLPRFRIADLERQTALLKTAQDDARALLTKDPNLNSVRGKAVRALLWLMEQDKAIRLISVG